MSALQCSVPVELLENVLEELIELRGERAWWEQEPRCGYAQRYALLCAEITQVEAILELAKRSQNGAG